MTKQFHQINKDLASFGDRLRTRRKQLKLSQEALGVLIGLDESCSRVRISRYESGVHEPSISTAKMLAKSLLVPVEYLYCERNSIADIILIINNFSDEKLQLIYENLNNN